jgi:cell division control protein 6
MLPESRIFKNEDILSTEYLPELLPHRENQVKELASNLLPAAGGRRPQNTFLFGSPGIGKTAVTKYVFRQFEEYSGVKTFYINCWDYKTAHAILAKIAVDLGMLALRKGMSKDEILGKIIEACKKGRKSLIICLDEVDQLVFSEEEALYDLLRINQYVENPVGLVFVSNNPYVFTNVDPRIRSSLDTENIEFRSYSLEEMKDILQKRMELTFAAVEEGVLLIAANVAVNKGGDVRVGLECLLKAGRLAEQEHANKVKVEHVRKILPSVKPAKPEILKERVTEDEKIILEIVNEKREFFSGELYEQYCKKTETPVTERRFRDFVNHLAETGLIAVRERKRGIRGKTRVISKVASKT